ncbi:MAG TPA: exodeoxyribonuclease VII large subunit [Prolixibacteraceae bacterium]|nr:exodeoxyribonuclease VII large subunit [Prolixibacteraceae bacterium]
MDNQITLQELNALIQENLQLSFPDQIWVTAEIGELKVNRNGHCYIELVEKDKQTDTLLARSRATIWAWQFRFIQPYFETTTGQALTSGINVLVSVTVEFHNVYGLSLNIKDIDPAYTLGDMARKRQQVIDRLTEEGIFEMNRGLEFPDIPSRIAIISSPTAAGYEDFMNQLNDNRQGFQFYTKLFEATMQGNNAPASIIGALDFIYDYEELFDIVVIIRGGGSQMDLSCFDDYNMAAHIAQFPLPVLTGIGHDKDESVADMVAFQKLKTPTAVAEFLIERIESADDNINELEQLFINEVNELLSREKQRIEDATRLFRPLVKSNIERSSYRLGNFASRVKPLIGDIIEQEKFTLSNQSEKLKNLTFSFIKDSKNKLQELTSETLYRNKMTNQIAFQNLTEKEQKLKHLSARTFENELHKIDWLERNKNLIDPKNIMKRGFSITMKDGKAIKNASQVAEGDTIENVFYKGKVESVVKKG